MVDKPLAIDPVPGDGPARWDVGIDGEEAQSLQVKKVVPDGVGEDEWELVRETAAKVLCQCPDPLEGARSVTGLALGKVQSGKTLSYTALTALAIDNGYRVVVVLAGTKKPLLEQNYNRLCTDLQVAAKPNLIPFRNPVPQEGAVLRNVLQGGGNALIIVLKNRKRIEDARRLLSAPELRAYPTLIIDDEGDEASLNTQFRQGRPSAVYNSILSLRDSLETHAYIAYTATPQANLLINGLDGLSPDFGVLIEPGQGYCGGAVFFGEDRDKYVRVVPVDEADADQPVGIPDGLREAIALFLVGGAIRHLREPQAWHSMLVHNSNLRVEHERARVAIQNLVELWEQTLALPDTDPSTIDLLNLLRAGYDDLSGTVTVMPSWDDVLRQLPNEIRLEVWMVNSLALGRDPVGTPFRLRNNILVGGNMLGRGVTIPGLAVTYITRMADETNADTLEQRARWFGYKQSYLDLCRIYVPARLRDHYTELLAHEDDFWDALRRNERQGLSIRDWPRMFRLDMARGIRPTRQAVASYKQFRGQGWDIQTKVILDPNVAAGNIQAARDFFEGHLGRLQAYGNTEHTLVEGCPTEDVIAELLARVNADGTDWEADYYAEYLARLLVGGQLPTLDVVWMSQGIIRDRSRARTQGGAEIENQVDNPMQGPSPNRRPGDADYYPGDRGIHANRVQLQVHQVQLRGSDVVTTLFALYVPEDARFDLRYVVRGDRP
mgnify:CR=1 FL=1